MNTVGHVQNVIVADDLRIHVFGKGTQGTCGSTVITTWLGPTITTTADCLAGPQPSEFGSGCAGPDRKITGKVILDVPGTTGTLVVSQLGEPASEYNF
jgi:hypothetical protein